MFSDRLTGHPSTQFSLLDWEDSLNTEAHSHERPTSLLQTLQDADADLILGSDLVSPSAPARSRCKLVIGLRSIYHPSARIYHLTSTHTSSHSLSIVHPRSRPRKAQRTKSPSITHGPPRRDSPLIRRYPQCVPSVHRRITDITPRIQTRITSIGR